MFPAYKPLCFFSSIVSPTHSATVKQPIQQSFGFYLFILSPLKCPPGSMGDKGHKRDPFMVVAAVPCILVWGGVAVWKGF